MSARISTATEMPAVFRHFRPVPLSVQRHDESGAWLVIQERVAGAIWIYWLKRAHFYARPYASVRVPTLAAADDIAVERMATGPAWDWRAGVAKKRDRDYQRAKVYRWEDTVLQWRKSPKEMPFQEVHVLVRQCWTLYGLDGVPIPRIVRGRNSAAARGGARRISLPDWSRCREIVLHETSHAICDRLFERTPGHGPLFTGVYIRLLATLTDRCAASLVASAKVAGVHVNEEIAFGRRDR